MERTTPDPVEIPSALPGFEDDDAREKLLLENASDELEDAVEDERIDVETPPVKQNRRRWSLLRAFAAFAVFLCVLVVGIAWFFGMGWFSSAKTQAVNRSGQKEAQASPATEDEKLKMALNMIAPPSSTGPISEQTTQDTGVVSHKTDVTTVSPETSIDQGVDPATKTPDGKKELYSLPLTDDGAISRSIPPNSSKAVAAENETRRVPTPKETYSDDARGRSLFFGISIRPVREDEIRKIAETSKAPNAVSRQLVQPAQIPFGTLLPIRLVSSIHTLRNSGGFVRMELTRSVEGKGYAFPAGTMIVGNIRGGESMRAFVNVVGLIDPESGEFVKLNGELLGRDGASGIEGKRRNLTSQWARVFRGMKDTAASVLGSVGAFRSGGTVILSEPIRRGTESMTEDMSGAILKNEREDSFLEVAAGSNGYVLVTGLPENSTAAKTQSAPEAAKR